MMTKHGHFSGVVVTILGYLFPIVFIRLQLDEFMKAKRFVGSISLLARYAPTTASESEERRRESSLGLCLWLLPMRFSYRGRYQLEHRYWRSWLTTTIVSTSFWYQQCKWSFMPFVKDRTVKCTGSFQQQPDLHPWICSRNERVVMESH